MPEKHERDFLKSLGGGVVGPQDIRRLLSNPEARKFHAVRRALAAHPKTPRTEALALVPTLFWRDLAAISADARAHPVIRRAADQELAKRLPGMALAERVDLAGIAGRGLIAVLRRQREVPVVRALLRNRFTTEADVVAIVAAAQKAATILLVADDPAWATRVAVRTAAARSRCCPPELALSLVSTLPLQDLRELSVERWRAPDLLAAIRREVRRRLEGSVRVD